MNEDQLKNGNRIQTKIAQLQQAMAQANHGRLFEQDRDNRFRGEAKDEESFLDNLHIKTIADVTKAIQAQIVKLEKEFKAL